jgi:serine/threonine protein kinase/DNA-binding MarR family transcriptional regulator
MSTNVFLKNANLLVCEKEKMLETLLDNISASVLDYVNQKEKSGIDDIAQNLSLSEDSMKRSLKKLEKTELIIRSNNLIELTPKAKKRLNLKTISLRFLEGETVTGNKDIAWSLMGSYFVIKQIGAGATSSTFCARQINTHKERALKIFYPGKVSYQKVDKALQKRAKIKDNNCIPEIIEAGQVPLSFPGGESVITSAVVLKYISDGITFDDFLRSHSHFNPQIFENFIRSIGGALHEIEAADLIHGDLHEGNILVVPNRNKHSAYEFWVIDFIGVPSVSSPELETTSDIENFRNHLLRAAIIACEKTPRVAARILLGKKAYRVLQGLRNSEYSSFKEMLEDFEKPSVRIPETYFQPPPPDPFEWLRVEWIQSLEWLYKLFVPVSSRYETIQRFGNTWISGPRGCGKSHYLRILAFHPTVIIRSHKDPELADILEKLQYNFTEKFGVLFACRLGEFRGFVPEALGQELFDYDSIQFLKHVLIIKIINKTLNTIKEGLQAFDDSEGNNVLNVPQDYLDLINYFHKRFGSMAIVDEANPMNIFKQCLATIATIDNAATALWNVPEQRQKDNLVNETDLDEFFSVIKRTFSELQNTRFYILVDDASFGNIHEEMQKILNSLIRSVQANHCFKLTCDKFRYTLDTSDGRPIDPRNEVTYVDLGEISTKAQRQTSLNLSEYMKNVVNKRLSAGDYQAGIQDILGTSQSALDFLNALSKAETNIAQKGQDLKLAGRKKKQKAYYAGWNIIWSISHGSVRTLLELIEYIFKNTNFTKNSLSISLEDQDKAVRSYANNHYKAIAMLPGEYNGEPLGQKLQSIISAVGSMSNQYLRKYKTREKNRWYETISIERLDRKRLSPEAQRILIELVKNGLLLDEGITFSRAQFGLCQRYDMNKIFAPAFETTYRVRNHIYLSKTKFEELIIEPVAFTKGYRNKLNALLDSNQEQQRNLFEE